MSAAAAAPGVDSLADWHHNRCMVDGSDASIDGAIGSHPIVSRGARVLVVDDEPSLLRGYARILRAGGHDVETASSGGAALDRVRAATFDVVVSDIYMPGMDGIGLLKELRREGRDVPLVLVTANPDVQSAVQAVEYGAVRYLTKPVDGKSLLEVVEYASRLAKLARIEKRFMAYVGIGDREGLDDGYERALASLSIAWQPIVRWSDRTVFGYEGLVRTAEPSLPSPDALFHAAEVLGRLAELGRSIRARIAAEVVTAGVATVFVNLHPMDLEDEQLYAAASPLAAIAERVILEITERASLHGIPDLRQRMSTLRGMGFRIALDDLGAGYAGLTSFAHLEPEVVKLDMSLVRNLHVETIKQKLAASLIELCREMGMLVVAEGVETPDERDALAAMRCDLLQGYLFARPARGFPEVSW